MVRRLRVLLLPCRMRPRLSELPTARVPLVPLRMQNEKGCAAARRREVCPMRDLAPPWLHGRMPRMRWTILHFQVQ